jgi:putative membrane protein
MFSLIAEVVSPEESVGLLSGHLLSGIVGSAIFGFVGIVLLLLGYWLFDLITPRIDVQKELTEKNMAVAVVVAALLLGIAYVAAHVVQ